MKKLSEIIEFFSGYSVPITGLALGVADGICRAKNINIDESVKMVTLAAPAVYGAVVGVASGTVNFISRKGRSLEENTAILIQIANGTMWGAIFTGVGYGTGYLIG